jgi:hypothetical protein
MKDRESMNVTGDVGPQVLEFLFDALKIDDTWAARDSRAFAWWAHRLPQVIWADPVRSSYGCDVVRVHAVPAVLRGVSDTPGLRAKLAMLNRFMSLGALVASEEGDMIMLHSAARFHAENFPWLRALFLAAVGIQVADAHIKADPLARVLGGEPDASPHPRSGERAEPDELLDVIEAVFWPSGAGTSPWTEGDSEATAEMLRPWALTSSAAGCMAAEFPFDGDLPAFVAPTRQTALLTASSTDRHPQLGSGLLLRLRLPYGFSEEAGSNLAWMLNALEMTSATDAHTLGAWCLGAAPPGRRDAHTVDFVSFVPADLYQKNLLENLAFEMGVRVAWIRRLCLGEGTTKVSTPAEWTEALARASRPDWIEHLRASVRGGFEATQAEAAERASQVAETSDLWGTRPDTGVVRCWVCRARLTVTAETRGKRVRCPRCGTEQALPR